LLQHLTTDLGAETVSFLDTGECLSGPATPPSPSADPSQIALLQYTSGSSGTPRGVIVTHANLVDNQRQIARSFGHDEDTIAVSWLPMFHDMGLGTVLGAAWAGCHCVLMSPQAFLQSPARWLEAISRYRATSSGGPDFAYDLCARRISAAQRGSIDLSSWTVAYNGSEPVRATTLERFCEAFAGCGFKSAAFQAVYGLAEATLLVTSESPGNPSFVQRFSTESLELGQGAPVASSGQTLVGCGRPGPGMTLKIVNPDSLAACKESEIGEIWLSGASVAMGYWANEAETDSTFRGALAGEAGAFLRTGDLGFLYRGELFVTGRRKDLIIIRGRNHYPQDIEYNVSSAHPALLPLACAAFSVESEQGEVLVIVQEVARSALRTLDAASVVRAIRGTISEHHALHTHAVVLLKPSTLPRTTSGKVRRKACREAFLNHSLPAVAAWVSPLAPTPDAEPEPNSATRELAGRADRLIEWLRRNAADLINAHSLRGPTASPAMLLRDLAKQGLSGMQIEAEYGGLGLANSDAVRVIEQLAAIDFALAIFVGLNNSLGVQPIAKYGGPRLKALLLPGIAHGEELAAFAFEEPNGAGSRAGCASVEARADGEDRWQLFGTKYLDGAAHGASVINVFARHEVPPGISAFTVWEALDGLRPVPNGLAMGLRGFARDTVALHGVQVSRDNLLGSLGAGLDIAREAMSHTRLAIGSACIGGMKRCAQWVGREGAYRQAIDGKLTPNPVTLSRLGSITASITALECLVQRIAQALDAGYAVPSEAFAACKIQGPEMLLSCVDVVMQLGVSSASAETNDRLSCLHRDAGFLRTFGGTPEAVAELTGAGVMADDSPLRRLIDEALHAPDVSARVDVALSAVKKRMLTLRGALATRAQRWGHTRAGELTVWLVLLAAVEGSRGATRDEQESDRAHAWVSAQFEQALAAVRFGTPSETATLASSDIASTFAAYARTIGEPEHLAEPRAPEPRPIGASKDSVPPGTPDSVFPPAEGRGRAARALELNAWISSWLARRLQIGGSEIESARSFADHGLDSVAAVELAKALSDKLGRRFDETLLWNFPTIEALVGYVVDLESGPGGDARPKAPSEPAPDSSPDSALDDEVARLERELRFRS